MSVSTLSRATSTAAKSISTRQLARTPHSHSRNHVHTSITPFTPQTHSIVFMQRATFSSSTFRPQAASGASSQEPPNSPRPSQGMKAWRNFNKFLDGMGLSRSVKNVVIAILLIMGTIESMFWISVAWNWMSSTPPKDENGKEQD